MLWFHQRTLSFSSNMNNTCDITARIQKALGNIDFWVLYCQGFPPFQFFIEIFLWRSSWQRKRFSIALKIWVEPKFSRSFSPPVFWENYIFFIFPHLKKTWNECYIKTYIKCVSQKMESRESSCPFLIFFSMCNAESVPISLDFIIAVKEAIFIPLL